jgi:hypothetical protein
MLENDDPFFWSTRFRLWLIFRFSLDVAVPAVESSMLTLAQDDRQA